MFACCAGGKAAQRAAPVEQLDLEPPASQAPEEDAATAQTCGDPYSPAKSTMSTTVTTAPLAQDRADAIEPSESPWASVRDEDRSVCSAEGDRQQLRLSVEEQMAALLDEDKPILECDIQRQEAAQLVLPQLRRKADLLLEGVAAEAIEDARHFCSDDTLMRYLAVCESNVEKAFNMLKATVEWRDPFFKNIDMSFARKCGSCAPKTLCPCCRSDPTHHCFFRVGTDAAGREVIYSCAGRAFNKNCDDGMLHMSLELERIFQGNSAPGQVVWVIDFAGFGIADCHPRAGLTALPLFTNHYGERFAQIVLFGMPTLATGMVNLIMKLCSESMRRRAVILRSEAAQRRYMDAYWSCDPAMMNWLQAALVCKGAPGSYPDISLGRALKDDAAVEMLERCAALKKLK